MNLEKVVTISQMLFLKIFLCWKGIQELLISLDTAFFIPLKKIPYVASTKRIVYIFLNECQGKKKEKTKTKASLNLLL